MVAKNPFTKEQGAYLAYIQRWKATGEGLQHPCCPVHAGVEPTTRIRFEDFGDPLRRLSEVEFYLIALKNEGKTRGGVYPKLVKEARDLRTMLLIEEDKEEEEKKEEAEEKVEDADDKSTAELVEGANMFENQIKQAKKRATDRYRAEHPQGEDRKSVV